MGAILLMAEIEAVADTEVQYDKIGVGNRYSEIKPIPWWFTMLQTERPKHWEVGHGWAESGDQHE